VNSDDFDEEKDSEAEYVIVKDTKPGRLSSAHIKKFGEGCSFRVNPNPPTFFTISYVGSFVGQGQGEARRQRLDS